MSEYIKIRFYVYKQQVITYMNHTTKTRPKQTFWGLF